MAPAAVPVRDRHDGAVEEAPVAAPNKNSSSGLDPIYWIRIPRLGLPDGYSDKLLEEWKTVPEREHNQL